MTINVLKDAEWVKNSFMIPTYAVEANEAKRRLLTETHLKYTDTTLGGNMVMNPTPQFTRFADIKIKGRYAPSAGMGRYYSEALDDNKQVIHMRFGVPAFNSMTQFFTSFYDPAAGYLANTGRTGSLFFNIGRAAGFVVSLVALPVVLVASAVKNIVSMFTGRPNSKYYYLKPAMPLYWNAVQHICNNVAATLGVVPRMHLPGTVKEDGENDLSPKVTASFHKSRPDIYREEGGIDIYAVANRMQRIANENRSNLAKVLDDAGAIDDGWIFNADGADATLRGNLQKFFEQNIVDPGISGHEQYYIDGDKSKPGVLNENLSEEDEQKRGYKNSQLTTSNILTGLDSYLQQYLNSEFGKIKSGPEGDGAEDATTWKTEDASLLDYLKSEARDGSSFVSFRVDYTGSVQESFSNNSKDSDLQGQLNGMTTGARSKRFSTADGNLGDGPIASTVESVFGALKDLGAGAMFQVGLGGLMALTGRGVVDIPKHWESSSASLPRMDYTLELRSPYGNKMAMFQNLYVPLAMILAGALPLSTGKQSYTSPFLVEIHSKGRVSCRLGLIESLSITRGVGNLGWTEDEHPLGIDVSFTVADLSSIMHMPINPGNSAVANIVGGVAVGTAETVGNLFGSAEAAGDAALTAISALTANFDEDNTFSDYMSVLGSLGLHDMIYGSNKLKMRATQRMLEYKSWYSKAHVAQWLVGLPAGQLLSSMAQQGDRRNQ